MCSKISFVLTMLALRAFVGVVIVGTWLGELEPNSRNKETCHN